MKNKRGVIGIPCRKELFCNITIVIVLESYNVRVLLDSVCTDCTTLIVDLNILVCSSYIGSCSALLDVFLCMRTMLL